MLRRVDANDAAMSGNTIDDVVRRLSTAETGKLSLFYHPCWGSLCFGWSGSNDKILIRFFSDVKLKVEAATTLRDSIDHYTSGVIYSPFLKRLMPIFINILRGPCIFQSNSPEQVSI